MADEPISENAPSSESQSPPRSRRGRRGGRGRRGRGRRRDQPPPQSTEQAPDDSAETNAPLESEAAQHMETREPEAAPRERRPAPREGLQQSIDQVNHIIETLRESLDEMQEVLESLEVAERQNNADEAELESLRRALNRLQKPR